MQCSHFYIHSHFGSLKKRFHCQMYIIIYDIDREKYADLCRGRAQVFSTAGSCTATYMYYNPHTSVAIPRSSVNTYRRTEQCLASVSSGKQSVTQIWKTPKPYQCIRRGSNKILSKTHLQNSNHAE
jgi:hypothetical protein